MIYLLLLDLASRTGRESNGFSQNLTSIVPFYSLWLDICFSVTESGLRNVTFIEEIEFLFSLCGLS